MIDRRRALYCGGAAALAATRPLSALASTSGALERLQLLDRVAFGVSEPDVRRLEAQGEGAWLRDQLRPPPAALPPEAARAVDALATTQPLPALMTDLDAQNRAANALADPARKKEAQNAYQQRLNAVAKAAAQRFIYRALYSPNQLQEQMTWFWFNHFNVFANKANLRLMVGDFEDRAIRPNALGRFRDLLGATLRHPAMLRYLDNADNAVGRINENYARELMELHTLGVGAGYTQGDVQELARVLTGVGVDFRPDPPRLKPEFEALRIRAGGFEFNPQRHDFGDKRLLGRTIAGAGFPEVETALDILARHPATARHVCGKLALFFVSDAPSEALIVRLAEVFTRTDGDIAAVLSALFGAREFRAALGMKLKDPVRYVLSAVRLAYGDRVILNPGPVQGWINRLGEPLYGHETPDGYALSAAAWDGPGQMAVRFEVARQIGSGPSGLFRPESPAAPEVPAFPEVKGALWYRSLHDRVGADTGAALAAATSPQEWNALFLSSPEFNHR